MNKCCDDKNNLIYLGKSISPITEFIGAYNMVCVNCKTITWSTEKPKCKYKWYKYDKNKLKELLGDYINYE